MVHGRAKTQYENGLCGMHEVSVSASPQALRALAEFLNAAASELESEPKTVQWHRHVSSALQRELGCDFIVCGTEPFPDEVLRQLDSVRSDPSKVGIVSPDTPRRPTQPE
jgi:hypothetical protein